VGSPKTSTVGGGSATPTANAYNSFLQSQLGGNGQPSGNNQVGSTISNLLSGTTPSPGSGFFNNSGMANLPNAPSFTGANTQNLNNNIDLSQYGSGNVLGGMTSMGQAGNMLAGSTAPLSGGLQSGAFNVAAPNASMNMMGTAPSTYGVGNVNMANPDVNSARANAISGIINTQNKLNMANTNARYSAGGMGSLGTGASMAGAQQSAIGNNQLLSGLQGVTQQDITNNLQYGQLNTGNQLQTQNMTGQDTLSRLGLQNSNLLGNAQIGEQASAASAANRLSASSSLAGLNQSGINSMLNYGVSQAGLGLQGAGMDATNAMNQGNFNNNATQTNNANSFNNSNALNSFMQQLFGQNSSNALTNQNMSNQTGLGLQSNQMQGMMGALQQLFGGLNQSNQIGNPQAQTVQTPSTFSQIMSGLSGVAGLATGMGGGQGIMSMFGGGGNTPNGTIGMPTPTSIPLQNGMNFGMNPTPQAMTLPYQGGFKFGG